MSVTDGVENIMDKILFAVHTYYPQMNGVQFVTQYLAEGLAQKGYSVTVITNQILGTSDEEVVNGVTVYRIGIDGRYKLRFKGDKKKYYRIIADIQPDVLIPVCTQSWPYDWIASKLGKLPCKTILYTHGYSEYCDHYGILDKLKRGQVYMALYLLGCKIYYMIAPHFIRKFDLVIYITKHEEAYYFAEKKGFLNSEVLSNAVDNRFWNSCYDSLKNHRDEKIRILNVGNYGDVKNQKYLLEIFYQTNHPNLELHCVGSENNDYYEELCDLKNELDAKYGKKDVFLHIGMSREDVIEMFFHCDLYVMTSKREAFSISLCEAAASRLPIIGTPVGNAADFTGIIIADSKDAFVDAIERLASSEEERRRRGNELYAFASLNCRIQDKIDWLDQKILLIKNTETNDTRGY